ncbi:MAG: hypothetical protein HY869_08500 [Chloroflexi bacterium]|nr:hypothetical protein [Chloroflexota bacterium]
MKKTLLLSMILGLTVLACGVSTAVPTETIGVETLVAGTMQALTAAAPPPTPTPSGVPVSSDGVTFVIPTGLAVSANVRSTSAVEFPYINPSFGDMPQHTVFDLDNYAVQGTQFKPQIMVFRAAEYAQYTELTASIIAALQNLQYSAGQPLPESLPNGVFVAQAQPIQFQNGKGLRYLTQFDQSPLPVNNREMFYYFHGLTSDGQFYIQAILPLHSPLLVADEEPTSITPPDGVQFDWTDILNGYDAMPAYLEAVTRKLSAADPNSFTPTLPMLDALIQSINVIAP